MGTNTFEIDKTRENWVLTCAKEENKMSTMDWVKGFRGKHGGTPTPIEHVILSGFVTVDANQVVRLTEAGAARLADLNAEVMAEFKAEEARRKG